MTEENTLNDKWFIRFIKIKSKCGAVILDVPDEHGHIISAVADGWFYGAIVNQEWQHVITKLFHVSDLKDCRFYASAEMAKNMQSRIRQELSESGLLPDVGF